MTYKTLSFIHSLLEKEAADRNLRYKQTCDQYDEEYEGEHRTKELKQLAHAKEDAWNYYIEAHRPLEDFEDQEWH